MNTDELQNRVREAIYGHLMAWERQKGLKDMPIVEKYQNLSAQELSDLVLEGEEVFTQTEQNAPLISVKAGAYGNPYYETLIKYVIPTIKAGGVDVSRSSGSAYNVSDSGGNYYRVYDADLHMLKRGNSCVHPSQLLIPFDPNVAQG